MKRNENMGVDFSQGTEEVMQKKGFPPTVNRYELERAGRIWIWDSRYFLNDLLL